MHGYEKAHSVKISKVRFFVLVFHLAAGRLSKVVTGPTAVKRSGNGARHEALSSGSFSILKAVLSGARSKSQNRA